MSLGFISVIEAGNLENQITLLCRSIRKYCGKYQDANIYTFRPRKGPMLQEQTVHELRELQVQHSDEVLNTRFAYYPFANKIFVCAKAEQIATEDILVFLDSDTIFTQEPKELDLEENIAAAVCPTASPTIASKGENDSNDPYWQKLFALCDAPVAPFVTTSVSNKRIRAYWNSGLVAVRRSYGLFQQWHDDFIKVMDAEHMHSEWKLTEQITLSIPLARVADKVKVLDYRYNYPLPFRPWMQDPARTSDLQDLVHIHYHRWFNKANFLAQLKPPVDKTSEIYQWLQQYLPLQPAINDLLPWSKVYLAKKMLRRNWIRAKLWLQGK